MRGEGCGVSANEYSSAHGAPINFGDLTPYLIYGFRAKHAPYCKISLKICPLETKFSGCAEGRNLFLL
jgi:hypothetical protein